MERSQARQAAQPWGPILALKLTNLGTLSDLLNLSKPISKIILLQFGFEVYN
jgi:hypothetical protein